MDPVVALNSAFVPGSGLPCNVFLAVVYGYYSTLAPNAARNQGSTRFNELKRSRAGAFHGAFSSVKSATGHTIPFINGHLGYKVLFEALPAGDFSKLHGCMTGASMPACMPPGAAPTRLIRMHAMSSADKKTQMPVEVQQWMDQHFPAADPAAAIPHVAAAIQHLLAKLPPCYQYLDSVDYRH
jgi:hypothetical protein